VSVLVKLFSGDILATLNLLWEYGTVIGLYSNGDS